MPIGTDLPPRFDEPATVSEFVIDEDGDAIVDGEFVTTFGGAIRLMWHRATQPDGEA